MPCVFLTVPPFRTVSSLRREAKRVARGGEQSYQLAFEQILHREIGALSPKDLDYDFVAHLRDQGWITFLFLGFATSVVTGRPGGVVANLQDAPTGFSVWPDLEGFDADPYIGDFDPCLTVCLAHEGEAAEDRVVFPLSWSEAERAVMADPDRPIRERLGTLLHGLRNALLAMVYQRPEAVGIALSGQGDFARRAHREEAHFVRGILSSGIVRYDSAHTAFFTYLFRAAAPACAEMWQSAIKRAETREERIAILRRVAEIGHDVFGAFPIEEYVTEDGFEDWENVLDHLELREALVSDLTAVGRTEEAMAWRNGLHAELRRVRKLIQQWDLAS